FSRAAKEIESALRDYRFDQYAKSCYDFFWGDLCDWYLEAIKPAMKDPKRAPQTAQVLSTVLDGSLRLMHPMIPFITETLWCKLNEVGPLRGIANAIETPPSERLIKAAWPKVGSSDDSVEASFARLQEIVQALRNLRSEHKVDPKRTIAVTVSADGPAAKA